MKPPSTFSLALISATFLVTAGCAVASVDGEETRSTGMGGQSSGGTSSESLGTGGTTSATGGTTSSTGGTTSSTGGTTSSTGGTTSSTGGTTSSTGGTTSAPSTPTEDSATCLLDWATSAEADSCLNAGQDDRVGGCTALLDCWRDNDCYDATCGGNDETCGQNNIDNQNVGLQYATPVWQALCFD